MGGLITEVLPGSIAEELGICPGDELEAINGQPARDLIDYDFVRADEYIELDIKKSDGELWTCEVEKDPDEELGLAFAADVFDGVRRCRNHCLFCFIDQLQPQPRPSMLVKDDDYRMSFLEGNFITCTNMTDEDYRRIGEMGLSPLYVSVHAVDPLLRQRILGRRQPAEILLTLQRLISLGCTLHTQIVLAPDVNDGEHLDETLNALLALSPGVATAAVVPVGLTRFQKNPQLRLLTADEAGALIDHLEAFQQQALAQRGVPFVFPADELYVKAGRPFPPAALYGNFEQIENGVGMAALFISEWERLKDDLPLLPQDKRIGVVTGVNGAAVLRPIVAEFNARTGAALELLTVENSFYGPQVTATGLLTAACLRASVPVGVYDTLLLPANMLKFDSEVFLDDATVSQLAADLESDIAVVEPVAAALVEAAVDLLTGQA